MRYRYLARSLPGRSRPAVVVGAAGPPDGEVDVVRPGLGHLGQRLLGGRVDRGEAGGSERGATHCPPMNRSYDGSMWTIDVDSRDVA